MCIYLIHGFASAPKYLPVKADVLQSVFGESVKQLCYDSSQTFQSNMDALIKQVDDAPLIFVGTSLGAFYASKLAEYFYARNGCAAIFLNPCHSPYETLGALKGINTNFATGENFNLIDEAISSYQNIPFIHSVMVLPRYMLLNMDDELIDASETEERYKNNLQVIAFEHGGHRFENIASDEVTTALEKISNSYFIHGLSND